MQDVNEITLLKEGNVKITNLRAIIGMKTYAISNIASARMQVNEPKFFIPVYFMAIAAGCFAVFAVADMKEFSHFMRISIYISISAFLLLILSRETKYCVIVRSSVGELKILEANDKNTVDRIVRALNEAIFQLEKTE